MGKKTSVKISSSLVREFLAEFLGKNIHCCVVMTNNDIQEPLFLCCLVLGQVHSQFSPWDRREAPSLLAGGE